MSGQRDWQKMVKRGVFEEAGFTEQMKSNVLDTIGGKQRSGTGVFWKKGLARVGMAAVAACIFAGGIWLFDSPGGGLQEWVQGVKQAAGLQGDVRMAGQGENIVPITSPESLQDSNDDERWSRELPVLYQTLDARIWKVGDISRSTDYDILPGLSNKFSPLRSADNVDVLPLSAMELLDSKELEGFGTLFHYNLAGEDKLRHGTDEKLDYFGFAIEGISEPGTFYHYGLGHMYQLGEHTVTRVFGERALKVEQKQCRVDGEDCSWYLVYGEDGLSTHLDFSAKTYERDLDGDGLEEIIVTTLKRNQIYLFKEKDGLLEWASIREALGAERNEQLVYRNGSLVLSSLEDPWAPIHSFSFAEGKSELLLNKE